MDKIKEVSEEEIQEILMQYGADIYKMPPEHLTTRLVYTIINLRSELDSLYRNIAYNQ